MSYVGKVQLDGQTSMPIGSTLYGKCTNSADANNKQVILNDFDGVIEGVTVYVKFLNGNANNSSTLQVGSTNPFPVVGNWVCDPNKILSFTLDYDNNADPYWHVNNDLYVEFNNTVLRKISGQEVNLATQSYVDARIEGLTGLVGSMHFKGESPARDQQNNQILPSADTSFVTYDSGDVLLVRDQEYVYSKGQTIDTSEWILLGDEGSYALKTNTINLSNPSVIGWNAGATPSFGDPITVGSVESVTPANSTATVTNGVLNINLVAASQVNVTSKSIPVIQSVGSTPTLTVGDVAVVVP